MSTARQRQAQEKLDKCAGSLNRIGTHIVNDETSHHDIHELTKVISDLAVMLEYVTRLSVITENTHVIKKESYIGGNGG